MKPFHQCLYILVVDGISRTCNDDEILIGNKKEHITDAFPNNFELDRQSIKGCYKHEKECSDSSPGNNTTNSLNECQCKMTASRENGKRLSDQANIQYRNAENCFHLNNPINHSSVTTLASEKHTSLRGQGIAHNDHQNVNSIHQNLEEVNHLPCKIHFAGYYRNRVLGRTNRIKAFIKSVLHPTSKNVPSRRKQVFTDGNTSSQVSSWADMRVLPSS